MIDETAYASEKVYQCVVDDHFGYINFCFMVIGRFATSYCFFSGNESFQCDYQKDIENVENDECSNIPHACLQCHLHPLNSRVHAVVYRLLAWIFVEQESEPGCLYRPRRAENKTHDYHNHHEQVERVLPSEHFYVPLVDDAQVAVQRDGYVNHARSKGTEVCHQVEEDQVPQSGLFGHFLN